MDVKPPERGHTTIAMRAISSLVAIYCCLVFAHRTAVAQPMTPPGEVYYTVDRNVTLFHAGDTTRAYLHLGMREPVYVTDRNGGWSRVRTFDGANGQVRSGQLSNVWLRIVKSTQTLYVYAGSDLINTYPTDLGYNFFSDKEKRGSQADPDHWRTPEGTFFVSSKNASSQFHKALVLNYPNAEDGERGLREGLITEAEFAAIVEAEHSYANPPMSTNLGGWIEIHGDGTGKRSNWTQGCIALTNAQIDALWDRVRIGTPVVIEH